MAGLVGIYKIRDNSISINEFLPMMCNAIKHKEWYKTQIFKNQELGLGRVTLGILNPETQPIYNEDKSVCIMMEGEVFDYQSIKENLKAKGHKFTVNNDPEFVLHLYEEFSKNFVHKLNGSFLIIIYDNNKKELLIVNDRFGSRPLYYSLHKDNILFGSEVKAILEDKTFVRVVNNEAVLDFFTFGYLLGDKTLLKGVNMLPYASMLICNKNVFSIKNYWDFEFNEDYKEYPDEYYVNKLSSLLIQAVKRQMDKKHRLGVALSGGIDSRTIAGIINKIEPTLQIPLITFGYDKKCDDIRIAKRVAKELKGTHHVIHFAPDYLVDYGEKGVHLTDGVVGSTFFHVISLLKEMKKHSDILILGTLLDTMFHSHAFDKLYTSNHNHVFDYKLFISLNIGLLSNGEDIKNLFLESYYKKNKKLIKKSFKEIQNRKIPEMLLNKCSYLSITQRNRRFIFDQNNYVREEMEIRMPFLDNDLVDFYLTIPPRLRYNGDLITRTFKAALPELAKIPWQSTMAPVGANEIQKKIHSMIDRGLRGIDLLITKLSLGIIPRQRKRNYYAYDMWIRENERVREFFIKILLDKKTLSRGYFRPEGIKRLVDLHMSGKKNYSTELGLLITFELWHREFIDNA